MNEPKICQLCGRTFYPNINRKKVCLVCLKENRSKNKESTELTLLRLENMTLRYQLLGTPIAHHAIPAIPVGMIDKLIRLAHPDKHENSQSANDATQWLLSQRTKHR